MHKRSSAPIRVDVLRLRRLSMVAGCGALVAMIAVFAVPPVDGRGTCRTGARRA